MAANSKREQILAKVESLFGEISSITTTQRKKLGDMAELKNISFAQLPLVGLTGSLPDPTPYKSGRDGRSVKFQSRLQIDCVVYAMERVTPDTTISSLCDDIWVKFMAHQTLDDLCTSLQIKPSVESTIIDPYCMFRIVLDVQYVHGPESI